MNRRATPRKLQAAFTKVSDAKWRPRCIGCLLLRCPLHSDWTSLLRKEGDRPFTWTWMADNSKTIPPATVTGYAGHIPFKREIIGRTSGVVAEIAAQRMDKVMRIKGTADALLSMAIAHVEAADAQVETSPADAVTELQKALCRAADAMSAITERIAQLIPCSTPTSRSGYMRTLAEMLPPVERSWTEEWGALCAAHYAIDGRSVPADAADPATYAKRFAAVADWMVGKDGWSEEDAQARTCGFFFFSG